MPSRYGRGSDGGAISTAPASERRVDASTEASAPAPSECAIAPTTFGVSPSTRSVERIIAGSDVVAPSLSPCATWSNASTAKPRSTSGATNASICWAQPFQPCVSSTVGAPPSSPQR